MSEKTKSEYYTIYKEGYHIVYDDHGNHVAEFLDEDDAEQFIDERDE